MISEALSTAEISADVIFKHGRMIGSDYSGLLIGYGKITTWWNSLSAAVTLMCASRLC